MLRVCTAPLFNHSLINLNWPFVLRELDVCSSCILCMLHTASSNFGQDKSNRTDQSDSSHILPTPVCEMALNTYLRMSLRFALLQQERLHEKTFDPLPVPLSDDSVQRICRVGGNKFFIHPTCFGWYQRILSTTLVLLPSPDWGKTSLWEQSNGSLSAKLSIVKYCPVLNYKKNSSQWPVLEKPTLLLGHRAWARVTVLVTIFWKRSHWKWLPIDNNFIITRKIETWISSDMVVCFMERGQLRNLLIYRDTRRPQWTVF